MQEITRRHSSLKDQLSARQLKAVDVQADENCLFHAECYVLQGNENDHELFCHQVANHIQSRGDVFRGLLNYSPR